MKRLVILGAGPAGITAGWRLSELGRPVTVLERDGAVGGMGKTIKVEQYRVDYGPHTFHVRETDESKKIIAAIRPFFGEDPLVLQRGTRIFLGGKYYVYPLELRELLFGVPPVLSLRILLDYARATADSFFRSPKADASFEEWGVRNLGRTLYDLCFGIYSARVWGLPTSQISSKQAQRVAKLNLKNVILRTLGIKADPVTYFTKYLYPREGISALYEGMAQQIQATNGELFLHAPASRLEVESDRIARVVFKRDGSEIGVPCEGVISTLPLSSLARMIVPALPSSVLEHANALRYRSLRFVYLVIDRERLTDFHWVYLLDEHFRCNRVSEQKNVSPSMIPPGQTVLCIEISCFKGDEIWNSSDEELYRIAFADVSKLGFGLRESEVSNYFVEQIENAYPVYELDFEEHLLSVLQGVYKVKNLFTLGRHGLFLNNSMDDNVLLGMRVADHIARNGCEGEAWLKAMLEFMNFRFQGK